MKKTILFVAMATVMASCGNKTNSTETSENDSTTTIADTIALATVEQTEDKQEFESPDYAMLSLYGKVKEIKETTYEDGTLLDDIDDEYIFDEKGNIKQCSYLSIYINDGSDCRVNRDANDRIKTVDQYLADWDSWFLTGMTYNDKGQLSKIEDETPDGECTYYITYDENGQIASTKRVNSAEGNTETTIETFKIQKKDSHGNWTEIKGLRKYSDSNMPEGESKDCERLIQRTITYYTTK